MEDITQRWGCLPNEWLRHESASANFGVSPPLLSSLQCNEGLRRVWFNWFGSSFYSELDSWVFMINAESRSERTVNCIRAFRWFSAGWKVGFSGLELTFTSLVYIFPTWKDCNLVFFLMYHLLPSVLSDTIFVQTPSLFMNLSETARLPCLWHQKWDGFVANSVLVSLTSLPFQHKTPLISAAWDDQWWQWLVL